MATNRWKKFKFFMTYPTSPSEPQLKICNLPLCRHKFYQLRSAAILSTVLLILPLWIGNWLSLAAALNHLWLNENFVKKRGGSLKIIIWILRWNYYAFVSLEPHNFPFSSVLSRRINLKSYSNSHKLSFNETCFFLFPFFLNVENIKGNSSSDWKAPLNMMEKGKKLFRNYS